jgi:hypothetical protein
MGTLRWAINQSNVGSGNTVNFNLGSAPGPIALSSLLPAVTSNTTINGFSQGGTGVCSININGQGLAGDGLTLNGSGATVNGLAIYNMGGNGFVLNGNGDTLNTVNSGTDTTDSVTLGNGGDGVDVNGGGDTITSGVTQAVAENFVGPYALASAENEFVFNGGDGVSVVGSNDQVGNSNIGVGNGVARTQGNKGNGVTVKAGTEEDDVANDLVGANGKYGVYITGSTDTLVANSYIGMGRDSTTALGNGADGVFVTGASTSVEVTGSTIAANGGNGVTFDGDGTTMNTVTSNHIGVTSKNAAGVGNKQSGVAVQNGATFTTIGGNRSSLGNTISGNENYGIHLAGANDSEGNNKVYGNFIGTDDGGTKAVKNFSYGVFVESGYNVIGAVGTPKTNVLTNVISGNGSYGILVFGGHNSIVANYIGTDINGTASLGNGFSGVYLYGNGAADNVIGGATWDCRNVISANGNLDNAVPPKTSGLVIDGGATGNTIQNNCIGTDVTGTAALPNIGDGVNVTAKAGAGNIVGGAADSGTGNIISGNIGLGIDFFVAVTEGDNIIGKDYNLKPLPNKGGGSNVPYGLGDQHQP